MKELKIKLISLIFKRCLEVSFRGMKLEKMHTTLYLFCFHKKLCLISSPEPLGSQGELIGWP